ncbi:hypothetical protein WR25_05388 [Diploscapter pachys]|uniref:Uncharacterized protein n=1 Tax=Diploscapter pachys TaxID=2018661 RepID=A0A2A2K9Z7_9BILA|nr:hypothetical protein WR25_05388 [Diploscapter pachys]
MQYLAKECDPSKESRFFVHFVDGSGNNPNAIDQTFKYISDQAEFYLQGKSRYIIGAIVSDFIVYPHNATSRQDVVAARVFMKSSLSSNGKLYDVPTAVDTFLSSEYSKYDAQKEPQPVAIIYAFENPSFGFDGFASAVKKLQAKGFLVLVFVWYDVTRIDVLSYRNLMSPENMITSYVEPAIWVPARVCATRGVPVINQKGSSGGMTSPFYPNNYQNFDIADYYIAAEEGKQIMLNLVDCQTELGYDNLLVYKSANMDENTVLWGWTGNVTSRNISVASNVVSMRFLSDKQNVFRGFNIKRLVQITKVYNQLYDAIGQADAPKGKLEECRLAVKDAVEKMFGYRVDVSSVQPVLDQQIEAAKRAAAQKGQLDEPEYVEVNLESRSTSRAANPSSNYYYGDEVEKMDIEQPHQATSRGSMTNLINFGEDMNSATKFVQTLDRTLNKENSIVFKGQIPNNSYGRSFKLELLAEEEIDEMGAPKPASTIPLQIICTFEDDTITVKASKVSEGKPIEEKVENVKYNKGDQSDQIKIFIDVRKRDFEVYANDEAIGGIPYSDLSIVKKITVDGYIGVSDVVVKDRIRLQAIALSPRELRARQDAMLAALNATEDGNCFYNSVSLILHGNEQASGDLRRECTEHMVCVCDCVAGSDIRLPPRGTSWISCKG